MLGIKSNIQLGFENDCFTDVFQVNYAISVSQWSKVISGAMSAETAERLRVEFIKVLKGMGLEKVDQYWGCSLTPFGSTYKDVDTSDLKCLCQNDMCNEKCKPNAHDSTEPKLGRKLRFLHLLLKIL